MNCQLCGSYAPTKHVTFYQNIGALVMRFHRKLQGDLCKSCIHKSFWKMTLITLTVGWLGMISLVVAPIFVLMNLAQYLFCLGMPSAYRAGEQPAQAFAPPAAPAPAPVFQAPSAPVPPAPVAPPAPVEETLAGASIETLNPHAAQIASRLNAGEEMNAVAADIAGATGVTPSQAILYIHALIEASQQSS